MATLLFNSNYLAVQIPDSVESVLVDPHNGKFVIRCVCSSWPVTDLYQEWGVDDFPGPTAKWAATFLAVPAPNGLGDSKDPRLKGGEMYWITLHPSTPRGEPIPILCRADADRFFFAVATDEEATASLFTHPQSDNPAVWIPVLVEDFYEFDNPDRGDQVETFAHIVVYGEKIADWTKATIDPADS